MAKDDHAHGITREELKARTGLDDDFLFVNVTRNPQPDAIQLPHERIAELAEKLLPDKNAQIVVYEGG
ncbi:MAG TPA: hypothetical protein VFA07_12445 [Chthonomonadaceae bacterium]|nr:hypothetical protein [Chthonomonadaceae bacterium]